MSAAYRFVFDTSTLISALLFNRSVPELALSSARKQGVLLASAQSLNELKTTLQKRKFDKYVDLATRLEFHQTYAHETELVKVTSVIRECRDPKDDKFLELAVDSNATCIVTGDQDLTSLNPFRGIPILTPREFLDTFIQPQVE